MKTHPHIARCFVVFLPPERVIPLSIPSAMALVINCVRASPTMRKMYGTRGHHCLTPFFTLKLPLRHPLRLTAKVALPKKMFYPSNEIIINPHLAHEKKKNLQETLSYAFEKSNLRKTVGCLQVFAQCKASLVKTMLSGINLRSIKAVWSGPIITLRIGGSLNYKILAKILYAAVSNVIRLQ